MEVAVHHSGDVRGVGHDGQHLGKVEAGQTHGDVLKGFSAVVGINLHTHAVVGAQLHVGRQALVVAEEDVVALVNLKFLISEHGVDAAEREAHAVMLHLRSES